MRDESDCSICKHYFGDKKCRAFPDDIPKEILKGKFSHINPYKGDHGIVFEPIDGFDNDFEDDYEDEDEEG